MSTGPIWNETPPGWSKGKVKHLASVTLGKMLQPANSGDSLRAPYMRAANVQPDGVLKTDDVKDMWFGPSELQHLALKAGDVVVVEGGIGGYGRAAYLSESLDGWGYQNSINRLRPRSKNDGRFLAYYLIALRRAGFIESYCNIVSMPHLTAEKLAAIPVPLPPPPEQRTIADFLVRETAQIDTLITKQEQLIATLRERRASVIARATGWTGQLPQGWPSQRLSWLFASTASGTTPAGEDIVDSGQETIPWVTTGELRESLIRQTQKAVSRASLTKYSALRVHPTGSLLLAMYGATIGRLAILGIDAVSNQACCALIGPTRVTAEFARYSLIAGREWLMLDAAGGGQPNVNQDKVRTFRIPVPTLVEQRDIAAYLDEQTAKIDALIAKTERFIELSKERRAALITAAVTGQIDVRQPFGKIGTP